MTASRFFALAAILPLFPASAAETTFGGTAQVRLGYADNPFLDATPQGGSVQVSGTLAPQLVRSTALGQTVLSATYDREQYLSRHTLSDTIAADLRHTQQFTEHFSGNAHVGYSNSLNSFLGYNPNQQVVDPSTIDQSIVDNLTIGQRREQYSADVGGSWSPTERDNFSFGANYTRATYKRSRTGLFASDYSSYGGNVSYLRAFGGRTKVGLQFVLNHTSSGFYDDSTSYQPNVVLQQTLSQYWAFNGSVGAIFQKTQGVFRSSSHSLGFNASLCGTYPRHSICFTGSRSTAASGFGGLRTDLRFGSRLSYQLSERSSVAASVDYSNSKSKDLLFPSNAQKFVQAGVDYSRVVTQRISAGFGGRYQWRDLQPVGSARALSATVNLSLRFGRIR